MDLSRTRRQKAVLWVRGAPDGEGGFAYATPVEIDVRWQDKQELFIDDAGREVRSEAVVYLGQATAEGDYLYRGAESTLDSDHDDPETIRLAKKVRASAEHTDGRAVTTLYKTWL